MKKVLMGQKMARCLPSYNFAHLSFAISSRRCLALSTSVSDVAICDSRSVMMCHFMKKSKIKPIADRINGDSQAKSTEEKK